MAGRRTPPVKVEDFGKLYHGSHVPDLETIDWREAQHAHYGGMPYGHTDANFVTTNIHTALEYAETAADSVGRKLGQQFDAHVYEVEPTNRRYWGPDVHEGSWLNEGAQTRREALERHEGSDSGVSLRFEAPLKVTRRVDPEEIERAKASFGRWW